MNLGPSEWGSPSSSPVATWPTRLVDALSSSARACRVALARHPRFRWLLATASAGLAAWSFTAAIGQAAHARDAWGDAVEVWVADRSIRPGDLLTAERRQYPTLVVPPGALTAPPSAGAVALRRVGVGEVLAEADLSPSPGPAALAPPGSVVVAIADPLITEVDPGTTVIIVAEGIVLADDGLVTASADGVLDIAVAAPDAPMVAAAAHQHLASVLIPAPGPDQD